MRPVFEKSNPNRIDEINAVQSQKLVVVEDSAELMGVGGFEDLCIKIGYSEPSRAESR